MPVRESMLHTCLHQLIRIGLPSRQCLSKLTIWPSDSTIRQCTAYHVAWPGAHTECLRGCRYAGEGVTERLYGS